MQPTLAALSLFLLALTVAAQDPKPATPARPSTSPLDSLFKLVDVGRTHLGVRYPVIDKGVLTSMVTSERMTRMDDNRLLFEDAVIDQSSGSGSDDTLKFVLQRAEYNRQSEQLVSSQPSRIENKAYVIEGDSLAYDTKTRVARLDGRVRMIIFESPTPAAITPAAPAAPAPDPAPAAPDPAPSAPTK